MRLVLLATSTQTSASSPWSLYLQVSPLWKSQTWLPVSRASLHWTWGPTRSTTSWSHTTFCPRHPVQPGLVSPTAKMIRTEVASTILQTITRIQINTEKKSRYLSCLCSFKYILQKHNKLTLKQICQATQQKGKLYQNCSKQIWSRLIAAYLTLNEVKRYWIPWSILKTLFGVHGSKFLINVKTKEAGFRSYSNTKL